LPTTGTIELPRIMAYNNLVVNGCSYMEAYAGGNGHGHLADLLGIQNSETLAIGGSANTRIIRTTLKHSYQAAEPTFYVLGLSFLSRLEIPILERQTEFEGRWTNPQNQMFRSDWQHGWTEEETRQFVDLKLKSEVYSILDRLEDLMYRILSMTRDLHSRGHQVVIFNQADDIILPFLQDPRVQLLHTCDNIVEGLAWASVPWQHENLVPAMTYDSSQATANHAPLRIRHRQSGHHHLVNQFLHDYIRAKQLL